MRRTKVLAGEMQAIAHCDPARAARKLPDLWEARLVETWRVRVRRRRLNKKARRK